MSSISRANILGATCALGLGASLLSDSARAAARVDGDDLKTLAANLGLELAAIKIYTDALAANVLSKPVAAVLQGFLADHSTHRDTILTAYTTAGIAPGNDLAPIPVTTAHTDGEYLSYLLGIERTLAFAHLGAVGTFKDRDYALRSGSIIGVETTHVALLSEALAKGPAYPGGLVVL